MPLGPSAGLALLILWSQEVAHGKFTSSLVTLMKETAKNLGLLGSWDNLKTRIRNLDFMDGLQGICKHVKLMGIILLIYAHICIHKYTHAHISIYAYMYI